MKSGRRQHLPEITGERLRHKVGSVRALAKGEVVALLLSLS